jgi:hypothetical protein
MDTKASVAVSSSKEIDAGLIEKKLKELGYVLPTPSTPKGSYVNTVRTGNLIFTGNIATCYRIWMNKSFRKSSPVVYLHIYLCCILFVFSWSYSYERK